MEDIAVIPNLDTAKSLGLNEEEYDRIIKIMGRQPNFTELSIFSVMWSEHCSYKNSIKYLKTLPREGDKLLVGAGEENAGLVDIGEGLACAFKIESHNHPSAIEPYQGAATGVGGIHRDIFTMGARPIAALNSLRFGNPDNPHQQHLISGVVSGIGDYGNCLGVPTVGGEVYFEDCYTQNILVNAMSVGIVKKRETISASADGPGNPVFIVGSATGKDGIHGATFASAELTEDSAEDLPAVQVGDPFQEKLLLEASLEAIQTGALVGMQDMGAAGITCSTSEMSAKSGTGMEIDLDKVPTRQADMKPYEILLSESQERMLVVVKKGREDVILDVFEKWDLECVEIGKVTDDGHLRFYQGGELVADVKAEPLVLGGGAPVYDRETRKPEYMDKIASFDIKDIDSEVNIKEVAMFLTSHPTIASKNWITEQYDSTVRGNTSSDIKLSDAAVIRLKGTRKGLAMSTDCNAAYVYADPYKGAMIAVCEAARNVACSGARPVAITNCLNFGNPYNPEVYYQFTQAIKGLGEACRKLNTPVTGGNVSFYNQSQIGDATVPVFPTPTIGMLGIMEDMNHQMTLNFKEVGDYIYILGPLHEDIGSSAYLRYYHKIQHSPAPEFDLNVETEIQGLIIQLIRENNVNSVHDISDGGLFIGLIESAISGNMGFNINCNTSMRKDAFYFGESQSRIVISVSPEKVDRLRTRIEEHNIGLHFLGEVTEDRITIDDENYGGVKEWEHIYKNSLENILDKVN